MEAPQALLAVGTQRCARPPDSPPGEWNRLKSPALRHTPRSPTGRSSCGRGDGMCVWALPAPRSSQNPSTGSRVRLCQSGFSLCGVGRFLALVRVLFLLCPYVMPLCPARAPACLLASLWLGVLRALCSLGRLRVGRCGTGCRGARWGHC